MTTLRIIEVKLEIFKGTKGYRQNETKFNDKSEEYF